MRSTPSVGLFFALVAGLACLFALAAPLPGGFEDPGGGVAPGPGTPARCLRLSYSATSDRWLPTTIRLLPERYIELPPEAPWFRTSGGGSGSFVWEWRPAGPDSIDISPHHGPVLRLPSVAGKVTGRAGQPYYANVLDAMTSRQWRVTGVTVPCSTIPE